MPMLPSKTSGVSKSAPSLRRDDQAKSTKLPMISPSGGRRNSIKMPRAASARFHSLPPVQDLRFEAMALCKRHQMSFSEVMTVLEAVQNCAAEKSSGLPLERFRTFVQRALYVEQIDDDLLRSAYSSCATSGTINVDEFLNWYKMHMFSVVAGLTADAEHAVSSKLVESIAHRHKLRVSEVDRIYSHFQKYDLDKSGQIEFMEFEAMIKSLIGVSQTTDLPKERLQRFWYEMDTDGNGIVDFGEFAQWYIKYFPVSSTSSGGGGGVLEHFYASFSPDVQRSNCLDTQSHKEMLIRQESEMAKDQTSFSKGPSKRGRR